MLLLEKELFAVNANFDDVPVSVTANYFAMQFKKI
jgi:hypothetical protein